MKRIKVKKNLLIENMYNKNLLEDKYICQNYIDYIKKHTKYNKYISYDMTN